MVVERREFDEFFAAHYPSVVGVLSLALGDRELARDASQEAFARALERWPRVSALAKPDGWVYVTAMRWALRQRHRAGREEPINLHDRSLGTTELAERVIAEVLVADAIATLSARQRQAVLLRFTADLSLSDVARAMGCALGTVKATLHQALRALRIEIGDLDGP